MTRALAKFLQGGLGLRRLAGPILDKELRVSSRRRRNYVLRLVYLAALTLFIALMWVEVVGGMSDDSSAGYRAARMSEAGKAIAACIVWFQFVAAQMLAVVLLSTTISEEIVSQTLGVLMTTPISSFQIVLGKLLGKMLQLILLLAVSLPLLAVVRVFGGVPWSYVLTGLSITLTAGLFAGSVSMFFSVGSRRAYAVILKTIIALAAMYLLFPWVLYVCRHAFNGGERDVLSVVFHVNPFFAMAYLTENMMRPGFGGSYFFSCPLGCGIGLGLSAALLAYITVRVRKVALRQAVGDTGGRAHARFARLSRQGRQAIPPGAMLLPVRGEGHAEVAQADLAPPAREGRIRTVRGPAIIWKELRAPLVRGSTKLILGVTAAIAVLVITYLLCTVEDKLGEKVTHVAYGVVFVILGMLFTAVISATAITTEKETRSWPILLLTPLSDWQILTGKAVGVLKRIAPVWLLLFAHVVFFACASCIHPAALIHLAMMVSWIVFFLTCSGLYFSSRFKRTTTAVILNLGLAMLLWIAVPFVSFIVEDNGSGRHFSEWLVGGNPVVQTIVILDATAGMWRVADSISYSRVGGSGHSFGALQYDWPSSGEDSYDDGGYTGFGRSTLRIALWALAYILAGIVFVILAKRRLRRNVF